MSYEEKLKKFEEQCKSKSDAELEFLRIDYGNKLSLSDNLKIVLKEIHRRQEIKEQEVNNTQKSIKKLTIIILILTLLTFIVGTIQLLK